jgi:hypothetical protein
MLPLEQTLHLGSVPDATVLSSLFRTGIRGTGATGADTPCVFSSLISTTTGHCTSSSTNMALVLGHSDQLELSEELLFQVVVSVDFLLFVQNRCWFLCVRAILLILNSLRLAISAGQSHSTPSDVMSTY